MYFPFFVLLHARISGLPSFHELKSPFDPWSFPNLFLKLGDINTFSSRHVHRRTCAPWRCRNDFTRPSLGLVSKRCTTCFSSLHLFAYHSSRMLSPSHLPYFFQLWLLFSSVEIVSQYSYYLLVVNSKFEEIDLSELHAPVVNFFGQEIKMRNLKDDELVTLFSMQASPENAIAISADHPSHALISEISSTPETGTLLLESHSSFWTDTTLFSSSFFLD